MLFIHEIRAVSQPQMAAWQYDNKSGQILGLTATHLCIPNW